MPDRPAPPLDIAALRALCDAATDGPWVAQARFGEEYDPEEYLVVMDRDTDNTILYEHDARFIAAARTALPACLDELARLRALLAEAEAALRRVDTSITDYSRGQQHFEVLQEVVENVRAALSRIAAAKEGGKLTERQEPCEWCGRSDYVTDGSGRDSPWHACDPAAVSAFARAEERRKVVREVVEWLRAGTWFDLAAEIERRFGKNDGG